MATKKEIFVQLRDLMKPHVQNLEIKTDTEDTLYVDTKHLQKNKKPLYFGGVQLKKSYVSYHLMPVYLKPELVADLSPALAARMKGKSCFNFTKMDETLLKELDALTQKCVASYQAQGFIIS